MTLAHLLTRACISKYCQWEWFRDCTLEKTVILCPDAELAASLTRCWLPQIRQVLPDCTVRVGQAKAQVVRSVYKGAISHPTQPRLED